MLHPLAKMAGCSSHEEFYKKYPTKASYDKYMMSNGQANVEQNQQMNPVAPFKNSLRNVTEEPMKMGGYSKAVKIQPSTYSSDVPPVMKKGGTYTGTMDGVSYFQVGGPIKTPCKKCDGKMQQGGQPWISNQGAYYNAMQSEGSIGANTQMSNWNLPQESMNFNYSGYPGGGGAPSGSMPYQAPQRGVRKEQIATNFSPGSNDYSIDSVRKEEFAQYGGMLNTEEGSDVMKKGGWIQGAIKHPGRCTKGSPNYDCPKGSPQWNLAQRFRHGDLHKKQEGGLNTGGDQDAMNSARFQASSNNMPRGLDSTIDQAAGANPQGDLYTSADTPQQHHYNVNPWAVGAGIFGAGIGAVAGISKLNQDLQYGQNMHQNAQQQGLSSSLYGNQMNPVGSKGNVGITGSNYGQSPAKSSIGSFGNPIMQQGGKPPIYVADPNDLRLKAYQDSTNLYNYTKLQRSLEGEQPNSRKKFFNDDTWKKIEDREHEQTYLQKINADKEEMIRIGIPRKDFENEAILRSFGDNLINKNSNYYWNNVESSPDLRFKGIDHIYENRNGDGSDSNMIYKRPIQPVIFGKEPKKPRERVNIPQINPTGLQQLPIQNTQEQLSQLDPNMGDKPNYQYQGNGVYVPDEYHRQRGAQNIQEKQMGGYTEGSEHDLSKEQIRALQMRGYRIQYL